MTDVLAAAPDLAPPFWKWESVPTERGRFLVYDSGGKGKCVLLIHGFLSQSDVTWGYVAPRLVESGYRVIAFDLRGFGHGLPDEGRFTVEDLADDCAVVLRARGATDVCAHGHSEGSLVAQVLARRHPELVTRLSLDAPALRVHDRRPRVARRIPTPLRRLVAPSMLRAYRRRLAATADGNELLMRQVAEFSRHSAWAFIQHAEILAHFESESWIEDLGQPSVVLIHTGGDHLIAEAEQSRVAGRLGPRENHRTYYVKAGHHAAVTSPFEYIDTLLKGLEFLFQQRIAPVSAQSAEQPTAGSHRGLLALMAASTGLLAMDGTSLNSAAPTLARLAGATPGTLSWMVDAFVLTSAALVLLAGNLADRFGPRSVWVGGATVVAVASLFAAVADTPGQLIAIRAAMGLGAAGVMAATWLSVLLHFAQTGLHRATAVLAAGTGLGVLVGWPAGGLLVEHGWRLVFLVNVPVVLLLRFAWRVLPTHRAEDAEAPDWVGVLLASLAVFGIVSGVIEAQRNAIDDVHVAVPVMAGLALLGLFVAWQLRRQRANRPPMLDLRLYANRNYAAAATAVALLFFTVTGALVIFALYMQVVRGEAPLRAGLLTTAPVAPGLLLGSWVSRRFSHRPMGLAVAGFALLAVAARALSAVDGSTGYWLQLFPWLLAAGLALGLIQPSCMSKILRALSTDAAEAKMTRRAGAGLGANEATRLAGGALGVAVMLTLLDFRGSASAEGFLDGMADALHAAMVVALVGLVVVLVGFRSERSSRRGSADRSGHRPAPVHPAPRPMTPA